MTLEKATLCVAMIMKNEAANLAKSLAPLAALVDEMVVVDTGSEDGSVEMARALGAEVLHFQWINDFSAARNFGLARARADFILWLDGDNSLSPEGLAEMRGRLEKGRDMVLWATEVVTPQGDRLWQKRVFPNSPEARFVGRIHEQLVTPAHWPNIATGAEILHWGYADAASARDKGERNLELLLSCPETQRGEFYWLYQTGRTLFNLRRFQESAGWLRRAAESPAENRPLWGHAMILLSQSQTRLGRRQEAEETARLLVAAEPGYGPGHYHLGKLLYDGQDFQEAGESLETALILGTGDKVWGASEEILNFRAAFMLGRAWKESGRRTPARQAYQLALSLDPKNPEPPFAQEPKAIWNGCWNWPRPTGGPWTCGGGFPAARLEAPVESLRIGFYTAGTPFEGDALERGALGGSETAFIQITRALARRGHQVSAFNSCLKAGIYHDVTYYPFSASLSVLAREQFDVFVVSRYCAFYNLPLKSYLKILWNHDTLDNPRELRSVHDEIDIFLVLSNFHKDNYLLRLPQIDDRLVVTRNGLDFDLLDKSAGGSKDPNKVIYASRPERGLRNLLEDVWPRLKRSFPDLRLHICGYGIKLDNLPPELAALYDRVNLLLESTPGLVLLGNLSKGEYYRHLSESSLMLYPSVFPEVSCLAALEAQALGVPVLTSDAFALSETVVAPQTKIGGKPGSPQYVNDYVERAIELLGNRPLLEKIGRNSKEKIRARYGWDQIAAEWERMFSLSLKARDTQSYLLETGPENDLRLH